MSLKVVSIEKLDSTTCLLGVFSKQAIQYVTAPFKSIAAKISIGVTVTLDDVEVIKIGDMTKYKHPLHGDCYAKTSQPRTIPIFLDARAVGTGVIASELDGSTSVITEMYSGLAYLNTTRCKFTYSAIYDIVELKLEN